MRLPTFHDIQGYDQAHGTAWIGAIRSVCTRHAAPGQALGVFLQFRTDWVSGGLRYALLQTLRYVGYGYETAFIFKDIGDVIGRLLEAIESER